MLIIVDSEGDPVQEFSVLYVNEVTHVIEDVFHYYVRYPFTDCDYDYFARHHIHGLDRDILFQHGLCNEEEVRRRFHTWLKSHPFDAIYGHAPRKEEDFLCLSIHDICLKPWKERIACKSHDIAVHMKSMHVAVCGITCFAHSAFQGWKAKKCNSSSSSKRHLNASDRAKRDFGHHCSLYDCVEIFLSFILKENY